MTKSHTDREFEAQLDEIRSCLRRMAGLVDQMIGACMEALVSGNVEQAKAAMDDDQTLDKLEMETDELCLRTLARWQPMASDLRFVTIALKMVTDLERIGDLAVNIAERAVDLHGRGNRQQLAEVTAIAELVRAMVSDATDAFVEQDAAKAKAVIVRDDDVDRRYTAIFRDVLESMKQDASTIRDGIHIQSVVKWLERMADHATNLAEEAVFMIEGKDIRHPNKLPRSRTSGQP